MLLAQLVQGQTHGTFGPSQSTYQRNVFKHNSNNPQSDGLSDLQHGLLVGSEKWSDGYVKDRVFYQWNIPEVLIPAGSTIDTVQIQFQYHYGSSGNHPLPVYFYNAGQDLVSPDIATLWSNTETGVLGWATGSQNIVNFIQGPGTVMANSIAGALSSHQFTLGIKYQDEASYDTVWTVTNSTVNLRIVFTRPLHPVIVDQQVATRVESTDSIDHWETNSWARYKAPTTLSLAVGADERLKATQKILTSKKYNKWTIDNEVTNYKKFTISSQTSNLTAKVDTVQNATIQTAVLEGGSSTGNVDFRDPWLIDSVDALYSNAPMNRGMTNALFKSVASGANNLGLGTSYNGVFLGQDYNIPGNPYYTVRAPQTVDFGGSLGVRNVYFLNWTATPANSATFQNANASQTPVVFNNSGATITANVKGSRFSSNTSTWSNNNQRKYIQTPDGWQHMVYESSMNGVSHVFYENKPPGGSWQIIANDYGVLYIDNVSGKSPSIDWLQYNTTNTMIAIAFQEGSDVIIKDYEYDLRKKKHFDDGVIKEAWNLILIGEVHNT